MLKVIYLTNQLTLKDAQSYAKEHPVSLAIEYTHKNGFDRKGRPKMIQRVRFVEEVDSSKTYLYKIHDVDENTVRKVEI